MIRAAAASLLLTVAPTQPTPPASGCAKLLSVVDVMCVERPLGGGQGTQIIMECVTVGGDTFTVIRTAGGSI